MLKYGLLILLIISWTLNPFIKKKVTKFLSPLEYLFVNTFAISFITLLIFFYNLRYNNISSKCLKKLDNSCIFWILFGVLITISSSYILSMLLSKYDAGYIIPHVQPLVIVFTVLIGALIFNEKINFYNILGILCVVCGLLLLNIKS